MLTDLLGTIGGFALRLALALAVVFIGRYLARWARSSTARLMDRPQIDQALSSSVERIVVSAVYYGIIALAVMAALVIIGVPVAAVLSIGSVAVLIAAVALRESLANFAATVIFMVYQPFRKGEEIESMGRRGIVRELQVFSTVLMLPDKSLVTLPNGEIQESGIINYSRMGFNRVDIAFTLQYGADIERARSVILETLKQDERIFSDPPPAVVVLELREGGVYMQARPLVQYTDYDPIQFSMRQKIKERLEAEGIALAVPQQQVQIIPAKTQEMSHTAVANLTEKADS
jgi:small conductance mechanosensitive channel